MRRSCPNRLGEVLLRLHLASPDQGSLNLAVRLLRLVRPLAHGHSQRSSQPDEKILQLRSAQSILQIAKQVLRAVLLAQLLVRKLVGHGPCSPSQARCQFGSEMGSLFPLQSHLARVVGPSGRVSVPRHVELLCLHGPCSGWCGVSLIFLPGSPGSATNVGA